MKFLLDTNAVSALMRGDPKFLARLRSTSRRSVAVSQPVLAELAYGIARLPRSKRKSALQERLERVKAELGRCDWNDDVSVAFGEIKANLEKRGMPIEDFDVAVAAHAVAYRAVLVTANVRHMSRIAGLVVEDWST